MPSICGAIWLANQSQNTERFVVKIYTKSGDDGTTGLIGPGRVDKDCPRIEAYGTVDELNAALGLVRAIGVAPEYDELLARIQDDLFAVGAALADPSPSGKFHGALQETRVSALEDTIDQLQEELEPLAQFILPGGTPSAAQVHAARTVCRRAERRVVSLSHQPGEDVPRTILVYLNRLGDLLFVLARAVNHKAGIADTPWRGL